MTDSLRDQLLKLGFKKPDPPARPNNPPPAKSGGRPGAPPSGQRPSAQRPTAPHGAAAKPRTDARPQNAPRPQPQTPRPPRSQEEIDLARAYALRDRQEREDQARAKREAEAKAKERREKRVLLRNLLQGKSLNDPEAELLRHFPQGDKIKRVHVNADQLQRLNGGDLGVVQMEGRYLLVDRECALAVRAVVPEAVVLLPEPGDAGDDDWTTPPAEAPASP